MKKIVIDAREYSSSTGRYIRKLLEYLERIDGGGEREYVVLLKSNDLDQYQPKAVNFKKIVADFKEFTFSEQLGFNRFLKSLNADLVHFTMVQQPVLYRKPKVTTMHDLTTVRFKNPSRNQIVITIKQQVYKWVNRKVARNSLKVIAPSEFVKNDIVSFTGIDPSKILVTYESADKIIEKPQKPNVIDNSGSFLLYVGKPFPHKNLERLIKAFVILQKSNPGLQLVLAGKLDANYRRIEDMVKKKEIEDIIFTDFVSEAELKWLYEHCAAYIFPSLSEGFGLPGLEAMVHEAPVVSSNATCLPEVYSDAAAYFDPLDVSDMANKIEQVIADNNLRQKLIENGTKRVKQFSWAKMAQQTLEIYKNYLNS